MIPNQTMWLGFMLTVYAGRTPTAQEAHFLTDWAEIYAPAQ
jgi:hypothetical protein